MGFELNLKYNDQHETSIASRPWQVFRQVLLGFERQLDWDCM
jgi:hypothetical protein